MPTIGFRHYAAEPDEPGWRAAQLPDGRTVHVAPMGCSGNDLHWSGTVEDPERCDCDRCDGKCEFCQMRERGRVVFTKLTGCYRSANSAQQALIHQLNHPDGPTPKAPWHCEWNATESVRCQNEPDAPPMPLATSMFRDGTPDGLITIPEITGRPPRCEDLHQHMAMLCAEEDIPLFRCVDCGRVPRILEMTISKPDGPDRYGMDENATRQQIVERSDPEWLGDVPIPEERRGGFFTHARYIPDCYCEEECACRDDETIGWVLEDYVAKLVPIPGKAA